MKRTHLATTGAPAAIGPYSQGILAGGMVFCSGQIGFEPATGQLVEGVQAQTERALRNLGAVLDAAGATHADVVKTTVFLQSMGDFAQMNEVYARFFPDPPPARSTIEVAALPRGALVEVEAIAVKRDDAT